MQWLKEFLDRRAQTLAAEGKVPVRNTMPPPESDLTDDDFWAILMELHRRSRHSEAPPIQILEEILEAYSDKQVEQFAERFARLNK